MQELCELGSRALFVLPQALGAAVRLAGCRGRRWIVSFLIDPANPQFFRLIRRAETPVSLIYFRAVRSGAPYRRAVAAVAAGWSLWETVERPQSRGPSRLPHLHRLETLEPRDLGAADRPLTNRRAVGSSPVKKTKQKKTTADLLLAAEGLFLAGLRVPAELTPLDPGQSGNSDSASM